MADPKDDWLNPDHYDDVDIDDPENPELTEADFANARPFREVFPEMFAKLTSQEVALELSPDTIAAFAEEGDDWKERMAATLAAAAQAKRAA